MMKKEYRSVFISDIHLATNSCKSNILLNFLKNIKTEYLFLVGDVIDIWKIQKGWTWTNEHNEIIRRLLKMSNKGTKISYIIGNHDDFFRNLDINNFGNIKLKKYDIHYLKDGRKCFIIHGDQFDHITSCYKKIAMLGGYIYDFLVYINSAYNKIRFLLGFKYWSLSNYIKVKAKKTTNILENFENITYKIAKQEKCNVIICGHIHLPTIKVFDNITYCNCGDWIENCSAIVENMDGSLEIIYEK
jgi:UDP-2,3-diacylglucosamine pyrophosphatase LpxH